MLSLHFWSRILGTLALLVLILNQGGLIGQAATTSTAIKTLSLTRLISAMTIDTTLAANPFFGNDQTSEDKLKAAVGAETGKLSGGGDDPIQYLKTLITTVANWLLTLLASLSVLAIIYAGFLWVTAHGEADPVTKAKTIVGYAVAGLLLAFFSYAIVTAVTGLRNQAPAGGTPAAQTGVGEGGAPATPDAGSGATKPPGGGGAPADPVPDDSGGAPATPTGGADPGATAKPLD